MKNEKVGKPEPVKAKKDGAAAAAGRAIVALASLCLEMRKVLLMCAPAFPEGSDGAKAVAAARNSLPQLREILQKFGGGVK